ncbi:Maltodextrin phosphorylase [Dermatophilus congolensis]|uniref:Alpha-1,4 glucan phosphorylase n=1 Tax=Dermatophilus congolensis TaxID=1863 RepID=A0AA46BP67_9MICO|nr:glycogen/starch/alpha-glucan phosphorylase [Dermatophilus congolensis]STD11937.1 Maltodextrin phosphorylase [Dermatophilus congolensis]
MTAAREPVPSGPSLEDLADETPELALYGKGPQFTPTSDLAGKAAVAPPRTVEGFAQEFLEELNFGQGVSLERATVNDQYLALARTVRQFMQADWLKTARRRREATETGTATKLIGYLSAEYLLGRQLGNALLQTGLEEIASQALSSLGIDLELLRAQEIEPGLGNGGLGRLAACFVDSLATLDTPSIGYGIRYEYGIFRQTFDHTGQQVEIPDRWLKLGDPWEFPQPDRAVIVNFGGHTEQYTDNDGTQHVRWNPGWNVEAIPYNIMVPGYRNGVVNTLRLWRARATEAFDLNLFNKGDYAEAVRAKTFAENITKVLYPEDSTPQGKELRLQQQYFFVAASLKDFIEQTMPENLDLHNLPERVIFQLNDTHPVIAIPEMMRILVDEKQFTWDEAWDITKQCFAYTCHTLLPEALEVWPVELLGRLLPRHLEIIYRINEDFLNEVRRQWPGDEARVRRMSIIQETPVRAVRMAYLATIAGTKVNGVAELHSQLLRDKVLPDFCEYWPHKFTNVTNGITPRRFLCLANPPLSSLITDTIGDGWVTNLERLTELEKYADDPEFQARFREVKNTNKRSMRALLKNRDGIDLPEGHLVDVMVKRLHEYKRQSLKLLHIVALYNSIISGASDPRTITPRTVIFGAKAAPGYFMAKQTIALINAIAATINTDERVAGRLAVAFPPNYNVTLAQRVIPAADLSEQISLAGKEASGTGNMKLALNGALTIGTDDGANIEIREKVGDDNFFLFGMTEPEVVELDNTGYQPASFYESSPTLKAAIDLISSGHFTNGDRHATDAFVGDLLGSDRFMALADFDSYMQAQARVEAFYADEAAWTRSAILNVARSGFFSSDRSMRDYLDRIWK